MRWAYADVFVPSAKPEDVGDSRDATKRLLRKNRLNPFTKPGTAIVGELLYLAGGIRPLDEAGTGRRNRLGGLAEIPSHWTGG